jgi:hypothetical protein
MPWPPCHQGKCPCYPMSSRRLGAPHGRSRHYVVTVLTELSRFLGTLNLVVFWYVPKWFTAGVYSSTYSYLRTSSCWIKALVSYFLCKIHPCVIILFFVDFYLNPLILLRWRTYQFTLQTCTNAVKHGSKNCYNHV